MIKKNPMLAESQTPEGNSTVKILQNQT